MERIPVLEAELEAPAEAPSAEPAASPSAQAKDSRIEDLDRRIRELEAAIGDLRSVTAAGAKGYMHPGRKTLPASTISLLAKQGVMLPGEDISEETISAHAGALDAALGSLSIEQRIAVKSQMMRSGIL